MRREIEDFLNEKMENYDIEFLSNKEEIIESIMKRFCRDCHLTRKCDICNTVRDEIDKKINEEIEGSK